MSELPHERLFGDYGDWPGRDVLDSGGDRLGGVREIYLDRETGRPEWVLVEVEGDQARFVPLADASVEPSAIRVAHPASMVHAAPTIGPEAQIDNEQERRLYEHYGIAYSEDASDSGLPADVQLPDAPAGVEDAPPEDTATAEAAAAGAGPTAADDSEQPTEDMPAAGESLWSEADAPAPAAPPGAVPGEETPGLPPSGPPEPPAFAGEEPATPGVPELPVTPGAPESVAPESLAAGTAALPQPPVPEPPPAAAPPPPPPPAPEGGTRRLGMAGGAALLALLLFILVRRLRS